MPVTAWLALGANLGDAQASLLQAMSAMQGWPHTRLVRASSLYRTAPVDADGPDYINAVVELQTHLPPQALLQQCQQQEQAAGRQRPYRNAPRTLDIDILLYGEQHLQTPELTIPHPRMGQRAFVLLPLAEIAPHKVTPQQLQAVADQRIERVRSAESVLASVAHVLSVELAPDAGAGA
ncbi:MAG: 2-amino-4-hydroxy-6-hydroxymethyldihydropteridine diphosphokinase [Brachymonas sp.]|nr:2-amino-4-hydroxy-6-hydroxymethyldihydropteridine diphosphokinase [Brachymonas sp.]